jgi:hypothetical protein
MACMALLIGSEAATGSTSGAQNLAPHRDPAGLRHAVPPGVRRALCGALPLLVWSDSEWDEGQRPADLCPECRALARDYLRIVDPGARRGTGPAVG